VCSWSRPCSWSTSRPPARAGRSSAANVAAWCSRLRADRCPVARRRARQPTRPGIGAIGGATWPRSRRTRRPPGRAPCRREAPGWRRGDAAPG
jgi:hypothetical protein